VALIFGTPGVNFLYWFYKVNREAATITRDRWAKPFHSLLAVVLGYFFVISMFWTFLTTARRVGRATNSEVSFAENFLISILLFPFAVFVYTPTSRSS
jgi:hypothetical protein